MATLHAAGDGTILRWMATKDQETQYPTAPAGTASTLVFARSNNKPLVNDLNLSTDAYRLNGTTLTKNGTPVTVNTADPNNRDGLVQRLDDNKTAIQAASNLNQLKTAVVDLNQIHRDHVRNGQPFPDE